jgi:hypothetical protein
LPPLSLQTLSEDKVYADMFSRPTKARWAISSCARSGSAGCAGHRRHPGQNGGRTGGRSHSTALLATDKVVLAGHNVRIPAHAAT